MKVLPLHEVLSVLAWLEGTWITEEPAAGMFPTIKPFNYYDEINITSIGQPLFNYIAQSWDPETGTPMHRETGFLQIIPDTDQVTLNLINNLGMITIEQGSLVDKTIDLKSKAVHMTDVEKPLALTQVRVHFRTDIALIVVFARLTRSRFLLADSPGIQTRRQSIGANLLHGYTEDTRIDGALAR